MKQAITPAYTFAPAQRTLDLSAVAGFSIRRLYGVLNVTRAAFLYLGGVAGFGYTALDGAVLTLAVDTTAMAAGDDLVILYESPAITVVQPQTALTYTTIDQALAASASYALPADPAIRYLDIEVVGTGAVRFSLDATPASASHGKVLAGAASSPGQGGGFTFEASAVPTTGLTIFALAATAVAVTIGR